MVQANRLAVPSTARNAKYLGLIAMDYPRTAEVLVQEPETSGVDSSTSNRDRSVRQRFSVLQIVRHIDRGQLKLASEGGQLRSQHRARLAVESGKRLVQQLKTMELKLAERVGFVPRGSSYSNDLGGFRNARSPIER